MKRFSRGVRRLLAALVLTAGLALMAGWQAFERFASTSAGVDGEVVVFVERGDGFLTVLRKLRLAGADAGPDLAWKLLARRMDAVSRIQVGEYALDAGATPADILGKLRRGEVIRRRFTIVEGRAWRELRARLAAETVLHDDISDRSDAEVMALLDRPDLVPEGRFLPETYTYVRGDSASDVLRQAMVAMDRALGDAWAGRADGLPLESPEELLVLASIIEKETGQAGERPQIAGVFTRRLRIGMRLQTDPTVIYGLGSGFDGNLRRRDLEADTPWNTYTRAGLPPTPIAMPGVAALRAAANPADGDTLYFVARGDGSHHFSATYTEHRRAVQRYQLGGRP